MGKRSYLVLDLVRSQVLGLNPTESILASCLHGLLSQNAIQYGGKPYFMADYRNVAQYCPLLPDKADTLRRLYKRLENIGLIEVIKIDSHTCFTPSQMLRDWGMVYESADAEKNPMYTEKNPVSAEKNPMQAEKNPTYINNINNNIKENKDKYNNTLSKPLPLSGTDVPETDYGIDTSFDPFAETGKSESSAETSPVSQEEGKGKEKSSAKREREKEEDEYSFERVWDLYDKKVGSKEKLRKKWDRLPLRDREAAFRHIPAYKAATPDKKYRKNFETYLNNRGWEDEIIRDYNGRQGTSNPYGRTKAEDFYGKGSSTL